MEMEVFFPGNQRVYAEFKGFTIETDQPESDGGDNSAASPFDLFLVSIATCAGYYAVAFMKERGISAEGAHMHVDIERDPKTHLVRKMSLDLQLPPGFPEKYRAAMIRSMDHCTVKRHLLEPPEVAISTHAG
jgi:putative redox protein